MSLPQHQSRTSGRTPARFPALVLLFLFTTASFADTATNPIPVLSGARSLSKTEAARGIPVQVRAQVTYWNPASLDLFVQDATDGIFVAARKPNLGIQVGDWIDITAVSSPGDHTPTLSHATLKPAPPPPQPLTPKTVTIRQALSGSEDARWLNLAGIIESATRHDGQLSLWLRQGGYRIPVNTLKAVGESRQLDPSTLANHAARIRGVCNATTGPEGTIDDIIFLVSTEDDIRILDAQRSLDRFDRPADNPATLDLSRQDKLPDHAMLLEGTWLPGNPSQPPALLTHGLSIPIRLTEPVPVKPELPTQVSGFLVLRNGKPELEEAAIRQFANLLSPPGRDFFSPNGAKPGDPKVKVLNRTADLKRLTPDEAALGWPVHIRAVITVTDPSESQIAIHDTAGGAFVAFQSPQPNCHVGDEIEITGQTSKGTFQPVIIATQLEKVGTKPLPQAHDPSPEELFTGRLDGDWVAIRGVVHAVDESQHHLIIKLASDNQRIEIHIPGAHRSTWIDNLVDAEVRVHGVWDVGANPRRQARKFNLLCPDPREITTLHHAPNTPPEPLRIESISEFGVTRSAEHKIRIDGTVTWSGNTDDTIFLQDETGSIKVRFHSIPGANPTVGSHIGVVGFIAHGEFSDLLDDADVWTRHPTGPVIHPVIATVTQAASGDLDATLIELQATVTEQTHRGQTEILILRSDDAFFEAWLDRETTHDKLPNLLPGTKTLVTGVCITDADIRGDPHGFHLLLRSPDDLIETQHPSWWSQDRITQALAISCSILILGTVWVFSLQRRVHAQTQAIHNQLKREAQLEAGFRQLFAQAHDPIFSLNPSGCITQANAAFERASGRTQTEWHMAHVADWMPQESRLYFLSRLQLALAPGPQDPAQLQEVSIELNHPGGSRVHLIAGFFPVRTETGETQVRILAHDITRLRKAELAARATQAELERRVEERTTELATSNRELEAFAHSVSHDLRAPLRAIDGYTKLIAQDTDSQLSPSATADIDRVLKAARRMDSIIVSLLHLSKSTRAPITLHPVNLSTLADLITRELQSRSATRTIGFVIEPGLWANADQDLITVALNNLLHNAWKYTAHTPRAIIRLGTSPADPVDDPQFTKFFVEDNGVGFNPAHGHKLFAPFGRLHSDAEFEGTGIGLATVHRIITRHNGRIWAQSTPGNGAVFYFTLPKATPGLTPSPASQPCPPTPPA